MNSIWDICLTIFLKLFYLISQVLISIWNWINCWFWKWIRGLLISTLLYFFQKKTKSKWMLHELSFSQQLNKKNLSRTPPGWQYLLTVIGFPLSTSGHSLVPLKFPKPKALPAVSSTLNWRQTKIKVERKRKPSPERESSSSRARIAEKENGLRGSVMN